MKIAEKAQAKRVALNYTQKSLAERCAVSFGSIKKFERTGQISLTSLLRIALTLDALDDFSELFKKKSLAKYLSIDQMIRAEKIEKTRKRGGRKDDNQD